MVGSVRTPRAILVGVHGHGRRAHLPNLRRLAEAGRLELVGLCDTRPPEPGDADGVPYGPNLANLIAATDADLVVLCTPIDTHLELALTALDAGCHLLLEKPPVADLAGFRTLAGAVDRAHRACQVGFQSFGSAAVAAARRLATADVGPATGGRAAGGGGAAGGLGEIRGIAAAGAWNRDRAYWTRAPWAGHRVLNGRPVMDGVLTNALAHAVATALHVAGADAPGDVSTVDTHLYRANDIQSDDTSSVTVETTNGRRVVVSATLCADEFAEPRLVVHGTHGTATLWWLRDELVLNGPGGADPVSYPRTDLLTDLLDHIADPEGHPLLAPLELTGAFTRVLEAIRVSPDPVPLPAGDEDGTWTEDRDGARRIAGVTAAVTAATDRLAGFSDLPWPPSVPSGGTAGGTGGVGRPPA
jgi:predicted dehydrogenase